MIELKELTKVFYQNKTPLKVVDSVNLRVSKGEICIFLGPSGCGKTTTLKMINRLIQPTSGTVLIDGEDTSSIDEVTLRRNIGYVIQQIGLFPNMTIAENISIVPKLLGWDKRESREKAKELMSMVALDPNKYMDRYPRELSGGQQQRIGVIRALAADAPILLMDEPFGAVDPINRESIQNEFLLMQRSLNKTVIMVSHDIDEAIKLGDRIAIFRSGKLSQFSKPDELLANPKDEFVANFLGQDRTLKRLLLVTAKDAARLSETATEETTSVTALEMIDNSDSKILIVTDESGVAKGFVSRKSIKENPQKSCGELLKPFKALASHEENLRILLSRMYEVNTDWLPVLNSEGKFVGEVTQESIANYLSSSSWQKDPLVI